ncbi:hypothetical protein BGW42_007055 [Actinomortierella wolfii]|nr:hypothetical protein BGW42_007055 [Actinomortierella wolfii]
MHEDTTPAQSLGTCLLLGEIESFSKSYELIKIYTCYVGGLGRDATDVLATNVLMVYDMKNNRWTDSYGQVRSPQVIPRHSDQIGSETAQTSQYIRPFSNAVEPAPQHGSSAANGSNSPPLTYPAPPSTAYRPRAPHAIIDEPTSASMSPLISASTLAVPSTPGARLMNSEEIELKLKLMEEECFLRLNGGAE